jgi:hypothetical protein
VMLRHKLLAINVLTRVNKTAFHPSYLL